MFPAVEDPGEFSFELSVTYGVFVQVVGNYAAQEKIAARPERL